MDASCSPDRTAGQGKAPIKYAIVSHAHSDHSGGAKYLQDHFGTRIILSSADWDLLDRSNGTKPKRDMVATDGQKLTLGDTTLTSMPRRVTPWGPSPRSSR